MTQRLPVVECQRRLAILWLAGTGAAFLVVLAQTIGGKYGEESGKAWAWFVPTVLPTASLIVGVIIAQGRQPESGDTVSRLSYSLSWWLSLLYLILVLLTPIAEPLAGYQNPLDFLTTSTAWLTPVQSLVSIALGGFFVARESGNEQSVAGPSS
jgi:hypothetical protein